MQAEDLIQQKEWKELTSDELALVAPLAGTENEYNLLKKMLRVSAEDESEIPVLTQSFRNSLKDKFDNQRQKTSRSRYWLYAAAAVLILLAGAAYLLNQKPAPDSPLVHTRFNKKQSPHPPDSLPVVAITPPVSDSQVVPNKIVRRHPIKQKMPDVNSSVALHEISTLVQADTTLLAYITAVD